MKLERFEITGLLGRDGVISGRFGSDLSILTGRNGAGKTSLLKLIWYVMSGNIFQALKEVPFQRATIVTEEYECTIHRLTRITCKVDLAVDGNRYVFEDEVDDDGDVFSNAEDEANRILIYKGSSLFFPTFRRLEGGFTLNSRSGVSGQDRAARARNDIEEVLITLSRRMSNEPHLFVSSISTVDIVSLLLRQYADLSDVYNNLQQMTSQEIVERIKAYKYDKDNIYSIDSEEGKIENANSVIDDIKIKIEGMETRREEIMAPFDAVKTLVARLFNHTGISFNNRLSFGDAANAVNSDSLSAGEKQMLSFICYNAFYKDSVIFIDEPELSLHVDWQRQLFPILLAQQSSNQFVIATHSPFIYGKYPDKEVCVDSDRGDAEG